MYAIRSYYVNYLNSGKTLEDLNIEFGIKVSSNELFKDIFVLNYDQINSPKNHGIVKECRSLRITSYNVCYTKLLRNHCYPRGRQNNADIDDTDE